MHLPDLQVGDRIFSEWENLRRRAFGDRCDRDRDEEGGRRDEAAARSSRLAKTGRWRPRQRHRPCCGNDYDLNDVPSGRKIDSRARFERDDLARRYAADSVKFDDAKASTLDQIKVGDQLRARGTRGADGSDVTAEEIVTGAFRNIAGTISSIDAAANTIGVADLITKKPVVVKITPESQLRKLPPQMAQLMAVRLKGGAAGGAGQAGAQVGSGPGASSTPDGRSGAGGGRGPGGGGADLQQMLSRVPPATLTDLQKGDAVMIVSTEGTGAGVVTAITLVGGVEPILQASPNGGSPGMILPPWSLDAPGGDAGGQ